MYVKHFLVWASFYFREIGICRRLHFQKRRRENNCFPPRPHAEEEREGAKNIKLFLYAPQSIFVQKFLSENPQKKRRGKGCHFQPQLNTCHGREGKGVDTAAPRLTPISPFFGAADENLIAGHFSPFFRGKLGVGVKYWK